MLTHLKQLGRFDGLKGVVVGKLGTKDQEWERMFVKTIFGDLGVPVIYGCSIGHHAPHWAIPVGVEARLDTGSRCLEVSSPVS